MGKLRYLEDFFVGEAIDCGTETIGREEMIAFSRQFDPQPFHCEADAAAQRGFEDVIASGLYGVCLCMKRAVKTFMNESAIVASPGMQDVRFLRPLMPGVKVHVWTTVTGVRPSSKKPDRGLVTLLFELREAHDAAVTTWTGLAIVLKRA